MKAKPVWLYWITVEKSHLRLMGRYSWNCYHTQLRSPPHEWIFFCWATLISPSQTQRDATEGRWKSCHNTAQKVHLICDFPFWLATSCVDLIACDGSSFKVLMQSLRLLSDKPKGLGSVWQNNSSTAASHTSSCALFSKNWDHQQYSGWNRAEALNAQTPLKMTTPVLGSLRFPADYQCVQWLFLQ